MTLDTISNKYINIPELAPNNTKHKRKRNMVSIFNPLLVNKVFEFTQKGNLEQHIKIVHRGERDYRCEACGKAFSTGGSLKRHINICAQR